MAGGPVSPISAYPATAGKVFPSVHSGAGGNAASHEEGMGVMASLDGNAVWELRFPMPPSIPSGTLKLRLLALANATSGAAKVTVSDGVATPATSPSSSGNPSGVSLTSETQTTVTWSTSENDRYKEAKVTLTASPSGNDVLVVALTFNTSGWTLAQVSTWIATIIWE
jgi:hypothetical protein